MGRSQNSSATESSPAVPLPLPRPQAPPRPPEPGQQVIEDWVRESFERYDVDRSGSISKQETTTLVSELGIDAHEAYIDGLWQSYDSNSDGFLDIYEFDS
eukprot:SAG31_NODE_6818_length_1878_cov_1.839798_2_plen_99_part_01